LWRKFRGFSDFAAFTVRNYTVTISFCIIAARTGVQSPDPRPGIAKTQRDAIATDTLEQSGAAAYGAFEPDAPARDFAMQESERLHHFIIAHRHRARFRTSQISVKFVAVSN